MRKKKQITTVIDYDLYLKIKEKGYSIKELIEYGYKYIEKKEKIINEEKLEEIFNKFENIIDKMENIIDKRCKEKIEKIEDFIYSEIEKLSAKPNIYKHDISKLYNNIKRFFLEIYKK